MFHHKSTFVLSIYTAAVITFLAVVVNIFIASEHSRFEREKNNAIADTIAQTIVEKIENENSLDEIYFPFTDFYIFNREGLCIYAFGELDSKWLNQYPEAIVAATGFIQKPIEAGTLFVRYNPGTAQYAPFGKGIIILLITLSAGISFFVSALTIDRVLNPVKIMTAKVKAAGNRNFKDKLVIDSQEEELKEYATVFNEMVDKLNGYIERQKQFVSDASHELSTPITIILGHTNLLLRWGKEDKKLLENELSIIKKEALGMEHLVSQLLFFARSDNSQQQYIMAEHSLTGIATEEVKELSKTYPEYQILLRANGQNTMYCDEEAIKRVFRIVLNNALQYSTIEKKVDILIQSSKNNTAILIEDYGSGVPQEYLDKIFHRFFRVDGSRSKSSGGNGLGLAIAKEIILAHKGKIWAENKKNGGLRITILLPFFTQSSQN